MISSVSCVPICFASFDFRSGLLSSCCDCPITDSPVDCSEAAGCEIVLSGSVIDRQPRLVSLALVVSKTVFFNDFTVFVDRVLTLYVQRVDIEAFDLFGAVQR